MDVLRRLRSLLRRLMQRRRFASLVLGGLIFAGVMALRSIGALAPLEFEVYDSLVRATARNRPVDSRLALVRVTEADIGRFGHPLSDALYARMLETLLALEPRAVGVDIYRDRPVGEGAERLRAAITSDPRVVIVEKFGDERSPGIPVLPYVAARGQAGFSDWIPDPDGVVRRGLLYLWDASGTGHLSFALQLASRFLIAEGARIGPDPDVPGAVRVGATSFPPLEAYHGSYVDADARGYQYLLDFAGAPADFPAHTLGELLAGGVVAADVRDRVVIVGTAAPSVKDQFTTPFRGRSSTSEPMYGMNLHAHAVSQLLRTGLAGEEPLRAPSEPAEAAWTLLVSLVAAGLGLRLRGGTSFTAVVLAGFAGIVAVGFAAFVRDWWIPVVPPALAWLGSAALVVAYQSQQERAERNLIMQLFARNVGRPVADELWERRAEFMEGGRLRPQRLTITVLMADLKGYTAASEGMPPDELMNWINEFMSAMARLVELHRGAVDDYFGDGLKANFGVPAPSRTPEEITADARNAVRCALAMADEVERLNAHWRARDLPTARLRIGIHTGTAAVGEIGSGGRVKYTSVGDTVNTAARLEGFDKDAFESEDPAAHFRILVGDVTRRLVEGQVRMEPVGAFELRGKREPVPIHRVFGPD